MAARLTYCSYSRYKEKRAYIVVFTLAAVAVLIVLTQLELIREKYGWQVSQQLLSAPPLLRPIAQPTLLTFG